jgi:peroxiredoxin
MLLDTPICEFGWQVPNFTLHDTDGKSYTMQEEMGKKGLVIVFICNHCPYVQRIAHHLAEDAICLKQEEVTTLAIMSNDYTQYQEDSPENMKQFALDHGFCFPYLIDEDQSVGKMYGAMCTPDFFGFNHKGELQYRGRIHDPKRENQTNRFSELVHAMRQIAHTGQGPKEQIPSMGCSIKWRN